MDAKQKDKNVEVSARSVDEAVSQALLRLGLSREEVDVEVIKQGSRGLLGLLSEAAVVRVTARGSAVVESAPDVEPLVRPQPPASARPRRSVAEPAEEREIPLPPQPATPASADEQAEVARLGAQVLETLLDLMGLKVKVERDQPSPSSQVDPDAIMLNIAGDDLGLLIGRRGDTLRDLQFLTCLMISRRTQRWPNVIVDVEHYKSRREKSLTELARRMADRVRLTAEPIPLEPMPPHERRIVHLALKDDPDVRTESTGEDENRKVVVIPRR